MESNDRRRYLDASRKADDLRKQVTGLRETLQMIADIAEGSSTANSLPHIARTARAALGSTMSPAMREGEA